MGSNLPNPGHIDNGFGGGIYNEFHRIHRQLWRRATTTVVGKPKILEITHLSAKRLCDLFEKETLENANGFDPREFFTLGTLNVVSGFAFSKVGVYSRSQLAKNNKFVCERIFDVKNTTW